MKRVQYSKKERRRALLKGIASTFDIYPTANSLSDFTSDNIKTDAINLGNDWRKVGGDIKKGMESL